ncbi:MAG TPA: Spy/CpxP family protein refolding chaperone [Polyangiaceae bacterium]|jgi:Spy/CpxP family protein refolding chaperone|nr:Spy/CpxP family protein refolding chaperone [Polyangiaceae bacterium]
MRIRHVCGPLLALSLAAAGCGSSTPGASSPPGVSDVAPAGPTLVAQDDESTAELKDHHRHHHHGGFAMFIAMSLDSLGTTPEQNAAITKIQADMRAKMQPAHDAEKTVLATLADGVAAGTIDQAKVDAAIAQLSTASAGVHDAVADSLNQLHALLTPEQRAALVDKVDAHLSVWHEANASEESNEARAGHLEALAKELTLSPDQVDKIRASVKASMTSGKAHYDRAEAEAHLKAFGDAFKADTFEAKSLTTGGPANAKIATWGATRMSRFYEAVNPVLSADQRTKLAEILRKHSNYSPTPSPQSGT